MRKAPWVDTQYNGQMSYGSNQVWTTGHQVPAGYGYAPDNGYYGQPTLEQATSYSGVDQATMAAIEAEEVYRRQMHVNMFQSRLSNQVQEVSFRDHQAQGLQMGTFQGDHQWSQA